MKRSIFLFACLCLALTVAVTVHSSDEQKPFVVHMVVLDKVLPDGSDAAPAVLKFEEEVLKLAGGFTELGTTYGGSYRDNMVKRQDGFTFIIGAEKDITMELNEAVKRLYQGEGAFILSWPGKVLF